jgi:WD40 repeat protein
MSTGSKSLNEAPVSEQHYDAFLSHNGADKPAVEKVARELEKCGLSCWLDKWNLIPGDQWQPAIEQALSQCATCVIFFGPHGLGPWHNEEMRLALQRRAHPQERKLRVLPVILPGGERAKESDLPGFLQATTWVEFRRSIDDEEALHRLACGIKGIPPGRRSSATTPGECPYVGLRTFQPDDAGLFFGRTAKIQELVYRLRNSFGTPKEERFLCLAGASGSGKSSLALAGLIPAIRSGKLPESEKWLLVRCRPGTRPWESLQIALAQDPQIAARFAALPTLITRPEDEQRRLHLTARLCLDNRPETHRLFILIDQFEEVFTLCNDERERDQLIENVLYATTIAEGRTIVVLTLRADFYAQCANYPGLRAALSDHQSLIGPLREEQLREIIEAPVQLAGGELEPGLLELLLADMKGQVGALPFLEHALFKLWETRDGVRLTAKAYTALGRLGGALDAHAEEFFTRTLSAEEQPLCRQILIDLVHPGQGALDTKKRVSVDDVAPTNAACAVLKRLADARLVTTDRADASEAAQVELAHEALINGWHRLGGWVNQNRERSRLKERLLESAREWQKNCKREDFLYRGAQLAAAEEDFGLQGDSLSKLAREFLEASLTLRDREARDKATALQHQTRLTKRFQIATVAGGFLAAVGLGLFIWANIQRHNAQESNREAFRQLASVDWLLGGWARDHEEDVVRSSQLFLRSGQEFQSAGETMLAKNAALAAGLTDKALLCTLPHTLPHNLPFLDSRVLFGAIFNGDESRILTWADDGTARLWDVNQNEPIQSFQHKGGVNGAIFNRDESRILTYSADGMARLWAVGQNEPIQSFVHKGEVKGAIFSRDESRILTWGEDGTARLWAVGQNEPIQSFEHKDGVNGAIFSRDESRILTWADDGTARLWVVGQNEPIQSFVHKGGVKGAIFSRDESRVLTWADDGTARLWAVGQNEPIQSFEHKGVANGASFNRDESRILTWGEDGTARLWAVGQNKPIQSFVHKGEVNGAIFNQDESRIMTWGEDRTARLWAVGQNKPIQSFVHSERVLGGAFNRDGSRILTWSADRTARLWTVGQDKSIQSFVHMGWVMGAAFNRDGSRILTFGADRTARLWAVDQDLQIHHEGGVNGAIFNRDESRILTWGKDGTAQLWAVDRNQPIQSFHHGGGVNGAIFNRDESRILTWGEDGTARLWALGQYKPLQSFQHWGKVKGAIFNRDESRILTCSADGTARLWAVGRNQPIQSFEPIQSFQHKGGANGAIFSRDGNRILTWGEDGTARLWAIGHNEPIQSFEHKGGVKSAIFSPDESRILTRCEDGAARLWAVGHNEPIQSFEHNGGVNGAIFNHDGSRILTWGEDGTARLWAVDQNEPIQNFEHRGMVRGALFNRDESQILTCSADGTARLWAVGRNEPVQSFIHRAGWVVGGVFNSDESQILTWTGAGVVRLWTLGLSSHVRQIEGGSLNEPIQSFGHEAGVNGAVFNRDGSRILTWSDDGTARLWGISPGEKIPLEEHILELQVRSATRLYGSAELELLNFEGWMARKRELALIRAKR